MALVVEGSQAEAAGLKVGDILCFSGSDGKEEIMYDMFLELVKSEQRPLRKCSTYSIFSSGDYGAGLAWPGIYRIKSKDCPILSQLLTHLSFL